MRFKETKSKTAVLITLLAVMTGALFACGTHNKSVQGVAAPVKASFVLAKLHYGSPNNSEREIWCFEWQTQSQVDFPELFGSIRRYRTVAWAREAIGGDRIFQTFDLLSGRMDRATVSLAGSNLGYYGYGWRPRMPEDRMEIGSKGSGFKSGELVVRLEGTWRRVSDLYSRNLISADGPRWGPGVHQFDAFFGDVVVTMRGQEILRQRVERATQLELSRKCQAFPMHDLFVYLDGVHGGLGTAWFLDLTLGHPRPIQGPNELFPGRVNSEPQCSGVMVYSPDLKRELKFGEGEIVGNHYLLRAVCRDLDIDFGDSIVSYEWILENGKLISTKTPELPFVVKHPGQFEIKVRAYDKSGKPGPWFLCAGDTESIEVMELKPGIRIR